MNCGAYLLSPLAGKRGYGFSGSEETLSPRNFEIRMGNSASNPIIVPSQSANCDVQVSGGWECFDRFYFNSGDVSATGYHGMGLGDVEVLDFEYWTMSRMRLSSVDSTNNIVYLTGPTYQNSATNGFFPGHRYLIDNVLESLTQKATGQWYVDCCPGCANTVSTPASTWSLTYIAQTGENPGTDTVIVPQLPHPDLRRIFRPSGGPASRTRADPDAHRRAARHGMVPWPSRIRPAVGDRLRLVPRRNYADTMG